MTHPAQISSASSSSASTSSNLPFVLGSLLSAVLAAGLSACGGGEPDPVAAAPTETVSSATASEPAAEAAAVATATDAATADTEPTEHAMAWVAGSNCGLSGFQYELMQRINAYRARGASCGSYGSFAPTTALTWSDKLQAAAARHSKDMATNNFFSHTGSDGSNAGTRITQAGYNWSTWGENIAAGYGTVQAVVDGWMASPGHCANLMKPAFKQVGVACVSNSASTYRTYWTMDLARSF